jgi:hypothetical protein
MDGGRASGDTPARRFDGPGLAMGRDAADAEPNVHDDRAAVPGGDRAAAPADSADGIETVS